MGGGGSFKVQDWWGWWVEAAVKLQPLGSWAGVNIPAATQRCAEHNRNYWHWYAFVEPVETSGHVRVHVSLQRLWSGAVCQIWLNVFIFLELLALNERRRIAGVDPSLWSRAPACCSGSFVFGNFTINEALELDQTQTLRHLKEHLDVPEGLKLRWSTNRCGNRFP